MSTDAERRAFAEALRLHIEGCDVCHGPDDGCRVGQTIESLCIDDLGFDPYKYFDPAPDSPYRKIDPNHVPEGFKSTTLHVRGSGKSGGGGGGNVG